LTANHDKTARLWDAVAGKEMRSFSGHTASIYGLAFSPDGLKLLVGSLEDMPQMWAVGDTKAMRVNSWNTGTLNAAAFSSDSKHLLTGSGLAARLWEVVTGKEIRSFEGHDNEIMSAAISPDGKLVLTGSADRTARLWDAASGKEIRKVLTDSAPIISVAFSPNGKQILTVGDSYGAPKGKQASPPRLWDTVSGQEILSLRLKDVVNKKGQPISVGVRSAAFSRDGKQVLTGSQYETATLWEVASGKERLTFKGDNPVLLSPDSKLVFTSGHLRDNPPRLWDALSGKEIHKLNYGSGAIWSVEFTPDSKKLLVACQDLTVRLWDCISGRELCRLVSFRDGSWAVVDSEARYDSSSGGDSEWLYGVAGYDIIPLKQLKEQHYDPGLLAKYLGINKEPLRTMRASN
jgi:WD40 repeat protein